MAKFLFPGVFAFLLAACASETTPQPVFVPDVPSAYTAKVGGTWALVVAKLPPGAPVEPPGLACEDMAFPVDVDARLRRYLELGFRQIADDVVPADRVLTAGELDARGYSGQIVIGGLGLAPAVNFTQSGLTALVDSTLELNATMDVSDGRRGLLHRAFSVSGISHVDGGIICQNAPEAITRAAERAMQQIAVDAAAAFAAAPDIRLLLARAGR